MIPPPSWKLQPRDSILGAGEPSRSATQTAAAPARLVASASGAAPAAETGTEATPLLPRTGVGTNSLSVPSPVPATSHQSPATILVGMEPLSVPPPIPAAPVLVQAADAAADTALRVAWKWYGLVVVPIVVIAVSVAIWFVATSGDHESVADPASVRTEEEVESAAPSPERLPVNASVSRLDARWLPTATRTVVRLRMSALAKRREIDRVLQAAEPAWHPAIGRVIDTLQLKPAQIERLTWAACDLADWKDQSVAVIELKEEKDSIALKTAGESLQLPLAGVAWRRIPKESWSHPFALLDSRTILTGREELLRELADRKEPRFESEAIERLFKTAAADAEILLMLDLAAARDRLGQAGNASGRLAHRPRALAHALAASPRTGFDPLWFRPECYGRRLGVQRGYSGGEGSRLPGTVGLGGESGDGFQDRIHRQKTSGGQTHRPVGEPVRVAPETSKGSVGVRSPRGRRRYRLAAAFLGGQSPCDNVRSARQSQGDLCRLARRRCRSRPGEPQPNCRRTCGIRQS